MIRLSDCNGIRTYNHLVPKRLFNHLVEVYPPCFLNSLIEHLHQIGAFGVFYRGDPLASIPRS